MKFFYNIYFEIDNHANLLLVQDHYVDEQEKKQKEEYDYTVPEYHFAVIRDISRLISSQISKSEKNVMCPSDVLVRFGTKIIFMLMDNELL